MSGYFKGRWMIRIGTPQRSETADTTSSMVGWAGSPSCEQKVLRNLRRVRISRSVSETIPTVSRIPATVYPFCKNHSTWDACPGSFVNLLDSSYVVPRPWTADGDVRRS